MSCCTISVTFPVTLCYLSYLDKGGTQALHKQSASYIFSFFLFFVCLLLSNKHQSKPLISENLLMNKPKLPVVFTLSSLVYFR